MLNENLLSPDAVDPADTPHSEIYLPIARPAHNPRRHILLSDAYATLRDRCAYPDEPRLIDHGKLAELEAKFHRAQIADLITGGFLAITGFTPCDGVERVELGAEHARIGPRILDWYEGAHRQGAYVVDAKEFAAFLDDPSNDAAAPIMVPHDAPPTLRFFAGAGLRLFQSRSWVSQKELSGKLNTLFKRRHPTIAINAKVFDMLAAVYLA